MLHAALHATRAARGGGLVTRVNASVVSRAITILPGYSTEPKRRITLDPSLEAEFRDRIQRPAMERKERQGKGLGSSSYGGKGKGKGKGQGRGFGGGGRGTPWVERPRLSDAEWALRAASTELRRGGDASSVVASLAALVAGPLRHNVLHYAAAFDRLSELGDWTKALGVVKQMVGDDAVNDFVDQPDADASAAGLGDRGAVAFQRGRYRELLNHGLAVCGRTGQWRLAFGWVDDMRKQASSAEGAEGAARVPRPWLVPDGRNYTAALTACAKALEASSTGGVQRAAGSTGQRQGQRGNEVAAAAAGEAFEAALGLFGQMRERGDPIDTFTYNAIIAACARSRRWDLVQGLLGAMVEAGLTPTAATLDAALHPMSGVTIPDALAAVRQLTLDPSSSGAAAWHSNTTAAAHSAAEGAKRCELVALCPAVLPSAFLKNRLLTLAARDHEWRLSLHLLATPVKATPQLHFHAGAPLVPHAAATQAAGNAGEAVDGETVYGEARTAQVIGATISLRTLGLCGQWAAALDVLDGLFDKGQGKGQAASVLVDQVLLRTAVEACVRCHHPASSPSPSLSQGQASEVAPGVVAFFRDLGEGRRFGVPRAAASACLASGVGALASPEWQPKVGSGAVAQRVQRVALGRSLVEALLLPRGQGALPFVDEGPFLALLKACNARNGGGASGLVGGGRRLCRAEARALAEEAEAAWEAMAAAAPASFRASAEAQSLAASAWGAGGLWAPAIREYEDALFSLSGDGGTAGAAVVTSRVVTPALLVASLAGAAADAFDADFEAARLAGAEAFEVADGETRAAAAGVAAMAAMIRGWRSAGRGAMRRLQSGGKGGQCIVGAVSAADLNGALALLEGDGRPLLAFACAHVLSVARDPLTDGGDAADAAAAATITGAGAAAESEVEAGLWSEGAQRDGGKRAQALVVGDLGTFHHAMASALMAGMHDEALAVLSDLRASGLQPDIQTQQLAVAAATAQRAAREESAQGAAGPLGLVK